MINPTFNRTKANIIKSLQLASATTAACTALSLAAMYHRLLDLPVKKVILTKTEAVEATADSSSQNGFYFHRIRIGAKMKLYDELPTLLISVAEVSSGTIFNFK